MGRGRRRRGEEVRSTIWHGRKKLAQVVQGGLCKGLCEVVQGCARGCARVVQAFFLDTFFMSIAYSSVVAFRGPRQAVGRALDCEAPVATAGTRKEVWSSPGLRDVKNNSHRGEFFLHGSAL